MPNVPDNATHSDDERVGALVDTDARDLVESHPGVGVSVLTQRLASGRTTDGNTQGDCGTQHTAGNTGVDRELLDSLACS